MLRLVSRFIHGWLKSIFSEELLFSRKIVQVRQHGIFPSKGDLREPARRVTSCITEPGPASLKPRILSRTLYTAVKGPIQRAGIELMSPSPSHFDVVVKGTGIHHKRVAQDFYTYVRPTYAPAS